MHTAQFASFYRAVHGYDPFPWQRRLVEQVAASGWPGVLALPTAAGKTSALDIGVFTLAMQAGLPLDQRRAPLRLFFVIDRRLVVDQAADHARRIQHALEHADGTPVLQQVRDALLQFGCPRPLHVVALRGGMYRDETWAEAINQPTICVSTVDQVGSRVLFRGYGLSEYAWPVHAALTGNDALYLVDEAHLSHPFLATLRAIGQYRRPPWAKETLGGPFNVVEMSATSQSDEVPFTLTHDDSENDELKRRLRASKPATLVTPVRFESEAVEQAERACAGDVKVVGVVVNRVASARDIFSRLPGEPFADKVLLTGRIRPWDRDRLLSRFLDRVRAGRERRPDDKPLYVVATMTIEVGADIDFDFLVTEAAPLASLRQRFGRLDRLGRFEKAAGVIVLRKAKGPDPIYGDDLAATWEWLSRLEGDTVDFGINALDDLIRDATVPPPTPAPRHAPSLFPAHVDCLAQTSPAPVPSPDVAPFLHGAEALDTADVQVVWRADLQPGGELDWLETVSVAPPRSREALALPISAVRSWLCQAGLVEVADIEGAALEDGDRNTTGRTALRWRGPDSADSSVVSPAGIRPGDTVVVPSAYGGCDEFGWNPSGVDPVRDVGDECVNEMANAAPVDGVRRLVRLRLFADRGGGAVGRAASNVRSVIEQGDDSVEAVAQLVGALSSYATDDSSLAATASKLADSGPRFTPYPAGLVVSARVVPSFLQQPAPADWTEAEDFTDTDDTSALRGGMYRPTPVALADHANGVVRWVNGFVQGLGLNGEVGAALRVAARHHDLGKADLRFQALLYGDEPGAVVLAKSGRDLTPEQRRTVAEWAKLPRGFRHELVSVALVRNHRAQLLADLDADGQQLVEYLVGVHHGRGRPFPPYIEDDAPDPITLVWDGSKLQGSPDHRLWRLDSGWPDLFWGLVRRYGVWGARLYRGCATSGRLLTLGRRTTPAGGDDVNELHLTGLIGSHPLGALAAFGLLRCCEQLDTYRGSRLAWRRGADWHAVLHTPTPSTADELLNALVARQGNRSRGCELTWSNNIKTTRETYLAAIAGAKEQLAAGSREFTDYLASFACELRCNDDGTVEPTAFYMTSGQQEFLKENRSLAQRLADGIRIGRRKKTGMEMYREALFGPWRYEDPQHSLGLDPTTERLHALQARSPTKDASPGVSAAVWLAFEALPLFPCFLCDGRLVTTGFRTTRGADRRRIVHFTWPLWTSSVTLDTVRSLLSLASLQEDALPAYELRSRGIEAVYRCERYKVKTKGAYYLLRAASPCL